MKGSRGGALLIGAVTVGAFAVYVALTGGIDTQIGGMPLRSRSWERPAAVAAALALAGATVFGREILAFLARVTAGAVRIANTRGRGLAVAAMCWAALVAAVFGTHAAGGADSYGYVSQAELFAAGRLTDRLPRTAAFPWPDVRVTLAPLGYTPGAAPRALAPTYPPGLPLLMAPFAAIHRNAAFAVVPLCAALTILLCWYMGSALGEPLAGVLAAVLLSLSPTFLFQAIQPMSDVPTTAAWAAALLFARVTSDRGAAAAGAAASLAILIRPNLAPLAAFVVGIAATSDAQRPIRRALICAAATLPGILILGVIQSVRFGSPLASGYAPIEELFALENIRPNLARYPRWMIETHTPFIWLWLLAPIWFVRSASGTFCAFCWCFCVAVCAAYLPYVYFRPDEWFYTRFLLPAIPLMLVLGFATALRAARLLAPPIAAPVVLVAVMTLAASYAIESEARGVFGLRQGEQKYPRVAAFVRDQLPSSAYVFAMQHSGSIRYYSGRQTIRWDLLDQAWLDRTIAALRAARFEPYAVLDADELEEFRKRFGATSQHAPNRMVPIASIGATRIFAFH